MKEVLSWDSCEVDWCMYNRSKVLVDHANDGAASMVYHAQFKNNIQHSRKNTLTIELNPGLDRMFSVQEPPA